MDKENKIYFYLPDFYYKFNLNIELIKMLDEHPEYFYDNIAIGAVYGTFPGAIWNGGRVMIGGTTTLDNISETISAFNNLNIPVRFTFTNCLIDEKHIYDTYCNLIMDCANNGKNEVLVNAPVLENYLREKYKDFKYVLSTTRCERDIAKINAYCLDYDLVVTDYRDNLNYDFLSELKSKEKIELLINAYCNPDCKRRYDHYNKISNNQLNFTQAEPFLCEIYQKDFYEILANKTVIKVDDIYNKYVNMGFSNFKIEGRTLHSMDIIESYVYYLVKPEFKDLVRCKLVKQCWR